MSWELLIFLISMRLASLIQIILCVSVLSLTLPLSPEVKLALCVIGLILEACPLLANKGVCEQLFYHGKTPALSLYWAAEILITASLMPLAHMGIPWLLTALISAHGALLGRLFNFCLLSELPPPLGRLSCCLLSMPWFILISAHREHPEFLFFLLASLLFLALFGLILSVPALLRWHLEPFEWEIR